MGPWLLLGVGEAGRRSEGINTQTQVKTVNNGIFPSTVTGHIRAFAQSIFYRDQAPDTGGMGRELRGKGGWKGAVSSVLKIHRYREQAGHTVESMDYSPL